MTGESSAAALGVLIACFFFFAIGFVLGMDVEYRNHRPYCDCKDCTAWRAKHAKLAERKKGGEE